MTNDEQKILDAFRKGESEGSDFVLIIQHERLDTGGSLVQVKKACPTRIYEVARPLYEFAQNMRQFMTPKTCLFLLDVSENVVQIFDIKSEP